MLFPLKKIFLLALLVTLYLMFNYVQPEAYNFRFAQIAVSLLSIFWGIAIVTIIIVLILENRNPTKTLTWILILLFLPFLGFLLYLIFGRNFRKRKIYARKENADYEKLDVLAQIESKQQIVSKENLVDAQIVRLTTKLLENNTKAFLTNNNSVAFFSDGLTTFEDLEAEILRAKESIHLQFFVVKSDATGERLKEALIKKAKEGLEIRLLYDAVGSWRLKKSYLKDLGTEGIETASFFPVEFPFISSKLNYRNHRKITVIDGTIGYVGGVNIADKYLHKDAYFGFWRDTHLKIRGDAVRSLQAIFANDWSFCTNKNLFKPKYFPAGNIEAECSIQIISSGPDSNLESIMQGYFAMISLAEKSIHITTPYLVLNESMLTAVKVSALSGVDVKIIVPSKPDHHLVFWASKSYYQEVLEAGVKIYEYQKGFIHSKVVTVDGIISSIGSANMDIRSFTHNLEVNAFIYNRDLTTELDRDFYNDLKNCKEVTLDYVNSVSLLHRMKESTARLFSPLL